MKKPVTRYTIDDHRSTLIAAWATGDGDTATVVAALPPASPTERRYAVARTLTDLSAAMWRTYTYPVTAAGDDLEDNNEGWARQTERDAFATVLQALAKPHLPDDADMTVQSYVAVEEGAHRLGRALQTLADPEVAEAVAAEVQAEIAAIEQAELGDLSGRARQAVVVSRADASPVQIAKAKFGDRLVRAGPVLDHV